MNFKKILNNQEKLCAHHHYQMSIILTYILSIFLFIAFYFILDYKNVDKNTWQWFFFVPWTIIYSWYNLKQRVKIKNNERIKPLKRPIIHWIILGLAILFLLIQPIDLSGRLKTLDYSFIIFTLFVADGYWDFKNEDIKILKRKK